jgi:hypothetical protein
MIIKESKESIAIVVVGYNRLKSIKRLLQSISDAIYPQKEIPIIISIDASGDKELYEYVQDYRWNKGPKYVNIQENRLGLKRHIIQCGDLTKFFKGIILLEDDIFVSPFFYRYAEEAVNAYGNDPRISQISLYRNETNGFVGLPIKFLENGSDAFLYKCVSSWGECWTYQMWNAFKQWYDSCTDDDINKSEIPPICKKWTKAWSKYYNAYNAITGKYALYPYISHTTNFSDAGEHGGTNNTFVQVNLMYGEKNYCFLPFEQMERYDAFCNNEKLIKWLHLNPDEIDLDIYGFRGSDQNKHYLLSSKEMPYKKVKSFALHFRPIELNVKYDLEGKGLYLFDTSNKVSAKQSFRFSNEMIDYSLQGFKVTELGKIYCRFVKEGIKRKLYRIFKK